MDLYVELPAHAHEALQRELEPRSFSVPALEVELRQFGVFRSRYESSDVFLDIFDAVGPLGESILRRRQPLTVNARKLWVIAPEDLVLLKAFSDRPRDFEDLTTLFSHSGRRLDQVYIEQWARMLDESTGTSEVTTRIEHARLQSNTGSRDGR